MKILVVGPALTHNCTAFSITRACTNLKHSVLLINTRGNEYNYSKEIIEFKPDLGIFLGHDPLAFNLITYKLFAFRKITWCFDFDPKSYMEGIRLARSADMSFFMSPKLVEVAMSNGARCPRFMPMGADVFMYHPVEIESGKMRNIGFIGSPKEPRKEMLEKIARNLGECIDVAGEDWRELKCNPELLNIHDPVYCDEFNNFCCSHKVIINLTQYKNFETPPHTQSQRYFMVPATKTFMVSEKINYLPILPNYYEPYLIPEFKDADEASEHIEYYLHDNELRNEKKRLTYERTLERHTYEYRLERILGYIK